MSKFIHELGLEAKDKITGFKGIIIGRCNHITGCDTYGLKAKMDKEGKTHDAKWFDEGTVEVIGKGVDAQALQGKEKGGPLAQHPQC